MRSEIGDRTSDCGAMDGARNNGRRALLQSTIHNRESTIHAAFAADAGAVSASSAISPAVRSLVQDDEVILLLLKPSLLYIPLSCAGSLMTILIITLSLMWLSRVGGSSVPWIGWTEREAVALGGLLALIRLGWQALEWWSRVYVLTDRRVIRRLGVLRVAVFETQLRNIQHTAVFARLRERVCGLGSIGFATAGSDTFEAFWVMIRQPYAVHKIVVEAIRRHGGR
jgi:hypothetical protein